MKTQSLFSILFSLCLALFILSCAKDNPVVPIFDDQTELISARDAVVPFKGYYSTTVQLYGDPPPGQIFLQIEAEGNATHLGKSTWSGIQQTTFSNGEQLLLCEEIIFIAANRDQLIGWYDGFGYGNPFGPEGVTFEGTVHITHGTGRFEDVISGEIPYLGSAAMNPDIPGTFLGEITFFDGELVY